MGQWKKEGGGGWEKRVGMGCQEREREKERERETGCGVLRKRKRERARERLGKWERIEQDEKDKYRKEKRGCIHVHVRAGAE